MALVLLGINHNTANIDLREKVTFPPEAIADAMRAITGLENVDEAVIVSTCNRTELYVELDLSADGIEQPDSDLPEAVRERERRKLLEWLSQYHDVSADQLAESSYFYSHEAVVRHLMKVACGLDSMVLGEPQILGQIKSAYAAATELGVARAKLGKAFQEAFSVAKQVRTDTAIGENPVSVAYAAVTLAEQIFSDLGRLKALLIGAGETIELVARHLTDKGVRQIVVANRTLDNAVAVAERFNGEGVLLSDVAEQLHDTDIVVSSTNSPLPLLGKGAVERAIRKRRHRPILLVDLAVPRDIEPEVARLNDAYLYTIDEIRDVIEDNVKSRAQAAAEADAIIEQGVQAFMRQLRSLKAVSTLRAFRDKADQIRRGELDKARRSLDKGASPEEVLESFSRGVTNKLIHAPSVQMKKASAEGRDEEMLRLIRELFQLDDDGSSEDGGKRR